MRWTRASLFTFLNVHFLLAGILALTNLVLLTRLLLAWNTLRTDRPETISEYQANLKVVELQTLPLRGLPAKVQASSNQAARFYDQRMPTNYSSIAAELDSLALKTNVRKTRVQYTQVPAVENLAEVRMDVSMSGEYAPMMRFINGLERDRMFFIINGLTLTGQQGGTVGVRLRLTTYIHATDVDHLAPPPVEGDAADSSSPSALLRVPTSSGSSGVQSASVGSSSNNVDSSSNSIGGQ